MSTIPLVQPLVDGPVDIVGDVHGEIDALRRLMRRLGYANGGVHPEGRKLVFVGDLTDGGPNSLAVVRLVARLIDEGLAQAILGNHDLSILQGLEKDSSGNHWFFGRPTPVGGRGGPQALASARTRPKVLRLFRRLPLVLERDDLRIVHACWDDGAVEKARRAGAVDVVELFNAEEDRIDRELLRLKRERDVRGFLNAVGSSLADAAAFLLTEQQRLSLKDEEATLRVLTLSLLGDRISRKLAQQNWSVVKLLTSGPEHRLETSTALGGKMREEGRVAWWKAYRHPAWCVFGHYSRRPLSEKAHELFDNARPFAALEGGTALCVDYSVAGRWSERRDRPGQPFRSSLAALRWPERVLYFDNADPVQVERRGAGDSG